MQMTQNNEGMESTMIDFHDWIKEMEDEDLIFWNSLTKQDQLKAFCQVVRLLVKAELDDRRSYRGCLYDVFGFGPESYARAQMAGFLELHNCIQHPEEEHRTLKEFAKFCGQPEDMVTKFYVQNL